MLDTIQASLNQAAEALDRLRQNDAALHEIARAAQVLLEAFKHDGRVFSCGNGGSMCDAMHFAEELSGKFRGERAGLPAMAISDAAHITCAGNDFGYESIFSRFIEAHGRRGDVLLAISTSGSSKNIMAAAKLARERGMKVIALTGKPEALLAELADVHIATAGGTAYSDRVQELHIKVIHTLIELCEQGLFPELYGKK